MLDLNTIQDLPLTEADALDNLRISTFKRYTDILSKYQAAYRLSRDNFLFKKIENILAEAAYREFKHDINTMAEIEIALKTASN